MSKKLIELVGGIDINYDLQEENLEKNKKSLQEVEPFDPEPIIDAVLKLSKGQVVKAGFHLDTMITFGLMRGFDERKTWTSIYSSTSDTRKREELQAAVDFFSVKIGRQNRKDTLTVPRLLQVFPRMTWDTHCFMVKQGEYVERAEKAGYIGDLPMCLRYSGSPSVMGPDVWDTYRNEYFSFALALGRHFKSGQSSEEILIFSMMSYKCLTREPYERITMKMVEEAEAEIEESKKDRVVAAAAAERKMEMEDWMKQFYGSDIYRRINAEKKRRRIGNGEESSP